MRSKLNEIELVVTIQMKRSNSPFPFNVIFLSSIKYDDVMNALGILLFV